MVLGYGQAAQGGAGAAPPAPPAPAHPHVHLSPEQAVSNGQCESTCDLLLSDLLRYAKAAEGRGILNQNVCDCLPCMHAHLRASPRTCLSAGIHAARVRVCVADCRVGLQLAGRASMPHAHGKALYVCAVCVIHDALHIMKFGPDLSVMGPILFLLQVLSIACHVIAKARRKEVVHWALEYGCAVCLREDALSSSACLHVLCVDEGQTTIHRHVTSLQILPLYISQPWRVCTVQCLDCPRVSLSPCMQGKATSCSTGLCASGQCGPSRCYLAGAHYDVCLRKDV